MLSCCKIFLKGSSKAVITQDIEDFLSTDLGKTVVTNSSIQILMKQSPAAIDKVAEVFYLSEGEKRKNELTFDFSLNLKRANN